MILAARIDVAERAADLLEAEARTLRLMHTVAPAHDWAPDDSTAQADHDRMLLTARQLRTMAGEMRIEIDLMERMSGTRHRPRMALL